MTTPFFELLERRIKKIDSLLCIGLDPHTSQLPEPTAAAAIAFCLEIINQTAPYAAAFKPNSAFFEALGIAGVEALHTVLASIPADIPVVLDVKRGDIDTTAAAYAEAALNVLNVGCVTLSPYMGLDSIKPFVTGKYADRAAFVLCKTSNPSSKVSTLHSLPMMHLPYITGVPRRASDAWRTAVREGGVCVFLLQCFPDASHWLRLPLPRPRRGSHRPHSAANHPQTLP